MMTTKSDDSSSSMPALPPFLDECLRGVGQVVFCNSAGSGALMLAALFKGDPWLGTLAAVGTISATATAKLAKLDEGAISNGLTGYNGCLVGCAFSVFLGMDPWSPMAALATVAVAGASAPITVPLKEAMGAVPQWTLAFNVATLSVLSLPLAGAVPAEPSAVLSASEWLCAPLVGVSQIFVVNDPLAGAMMLGAIASYSPQCAGFTLLGSTLGLGTGLLLGAPAAELGMGLWGFNPALTSLAVSVFFVANPAMYALSAGGAVATAGLFMPTKALMAGVVGTPALTLPFCAVASACYVAPRLGMLPDLVLAASPHSPEKNAP